MKDVYTGFNEPLVTKKMGAGSQFLELIEGQSCIHMNFTPSYSGWDVCGPAALLMSRLGYVADAKGKPLIFEANRDQFNLWNGLIAARHVKTVKDIQNEWESSSSTSFRQKQLEIRQKYHVEKS